MKLKKIVLVGLGFIFLALGAIGLAIPVWPTTPFVLLSAACFSAAPQLRAKIMKIDFFREHIENYSGRTGLSQRTVVISLSYLWGMLLLSALILSRLWSAVLLLSIGAVVTLHILHMAKRKPAKEEIDKVQEI